MVFNTVVDGRRVVLRRVVDDSLSKGVLREKVPSPHPIFHYF